MSELNINHYEICCLLYAGDIEQAQENFAEKTRGQDLSPTLRNTYLSSLNFAIYNFILIHENVSLHECCLENEQRIIRAASDSLVQTGFEIIASYGMDSRYLIAKYKNPHIRNAVSYIHTHLNESLTLESVSDVVCISKNYFCQLFREEVGTSFGSYVCTERVRLARRLLTGTALSVQDIAEKCGFQTASYFSTCCRRCLGSSPSEIRRGGI